MTGTETRRRLFEVYPGNYGEGWHVREYAADYAERFPVYRGDISGVRGRDRTVAYLRRTYPGCRVRIER